MDQVAGIVVSGSGTDLAEFGIQFDGRQELAQVLSLRRKSVRTFRVCRVVCEDFSIFLHHRAAAGRVADDGVHFIRFENVQVILN